MSDAMGRRPDGPGWYWYSDEPCHVYANADGRLMMVMFDDTPDPVDICIGDFVPLVKPVAAPELREILAAKQHEIWAHWMRYLFSVSVRRDDGVMLIPADKVERWERQMGTDYADLTEQERESDRRQADKILAVLSKPVAAPEPDWSKAPEWAMWWAVDSWGIRMWFQREPRADMGKWREPLDGTSLLEYDGPGEEIPLGIDWRTTLRKRPERQGSVYDTRWHGSVLDQRRLPATQAQGGRRMTTPYALFRFVPLSECRVVWQSWVRAEHGDSDARERWRYEMEVRYGRRALAAVTAERDALRRMVKEAAE